MALAITKRAASTRFTEEERKLLESLRSVIRERGGVGENIKEETKSSAKSAFSFSQLIFIFAFALDLSLLYVYVLDLFPGLEQNSLLPRLAQLLPIIGGTLLVSYLDQIRAWILGLTGEKHFGLGCVILLPLLLAFQMHFYTLFIDLRPATAHVQIMDEDRGRDAIFTDNQHQYLKLDKPLAYKIQVENTSSVYHISAMQVLRGTLARLRWLRLSPLRLEELYEVTITSPQPKGQLQVLAQDTPGMRISGLERSLLPIPPVRKDKQPAASKPDQNGKVEYSWSHSFEDDGTPSIRLPAGTYDFILSVKGCTKRLPGKEVPGELIDFLPACEGQ